MLLPSLIVRIKGLGHEKPLHATFANAGIGNEL